MGTLISEGRGVVGKSVDGANGYITSRLLVSTPGGRRSAGTSTVSCSSGHTALLPVAFTSIVSRGKAALTEVKGLKLDAPVTPSGFFEVGGGGGAAALDAGPEAEVLSAFGAAKGVIEVAAADGAS